MTVRIVLKDNGCLVFTDVIMVERDKEFLYIYYQIMNKILHSKVNSENIRKIIIV